MNRQLARVGGLRNQEGSLRFHDDSEEGGRFGRLLSLPLELSNSLLLDYKIAQLFNTASCDCIQPDRNPLWQNLYGMETIGKRAHRPNYRVLHHDIGMAKHRVLRELSLNVTEELIMYSVNAFEKCTHIFKAS